MIQRVKFIGYQAFAWILIFQFVRGVFHVYQYFLNNGQSSVFMLDSARHGLRMDVSMTAYLLAVPTLLLALTARKWRWYARFSNTYALIVSLLVSLIVTSDLETFRAWHFRLDTTPLYFLANPAEALASAGSSPLLLLMCIFLVIFTGMAFSHHIITKRLVGGFVPSHRWLTPLLFTFLAVSLVIPMRGGLQLAPMNQSAVYFSSDNFANQAAINVVWNFFSSAIHATGRNHNPFYRMNASKAKELMQALRPGAQCTLSRIPPPGKPNVLLIIWESFTAKAVGSLGGLPGITPQFDSLAKQGMLFTNIYASGDRSPKGVVAILSGYPAQPTTSIISFPNKTARLPSLTRSFRNDGYHTAFYYGGESEFANIKSYLLQQGFDTLIDKRAFDDSVMNSKWGAHDHVVFQRLLTDLENQSTPFFTTFFTLSSHEPFEVPVEKVIPGDDLENKFLNSLHYTDASLGDFIRKARTKPWWANTLVVITADHGHPMPKGTGDRSSQFHIPMLWLGGVIEQREARIDTLGSQVDIAATLLNQLGHDSSGFIWSNDLFRRERVPYAYYAFNNGFGWIRPYGRLVYENVGNREIEKSGRVLPMDKTTGQAYLQTLFSDYLKR